MAVSPSFCFLDTSSESVLSCSSNSYYIISVWWQYLVGAWQFSDGESVYGISRKAKVMPYQFEPELSPHGNSPVDVALSALHATTTNRCWEYGGDCIWFKARSYARISTASRYT